MLRMLKVFKSCKKGFTLLELLVVVLIIGILASIALPQYRKAVYKSRYNSLMALTNALYQAEEVYFLANNQYTEDLTALDIDLSGCEISNNKKSCTFDWGVCVLSLSDAIGSIGDSAACYRTEGLQNGYVYFFRLNNSSVRKQRLCFAKRAEKNNVWDQVCKDAGADFWTPGSTQQLGGAINIYKF